MKMSNGSMSTIKTSTFTNENLYSFQHNSMESELISKLTLSLLSAGIDKKKPIVCLFDLEGKILIINNSGKKYLHGSPSKNGDYYLQENFLAPEAKADFDIYLSVLLEEVKYKGHVKVVNDQGKERVLEIELELKTLGDFSYVHGIGKDVTNEWLKGKNNKKLTGKTNKTFSTSRRPIFIINKEGVVLDINRSAIKQYDLKKSNIVGKELRDLSELLGISYDKLKLSIEKAFTSRSLSIIWHPTPWIENRIFESVFKKSLYNDEEVVIFLNREVTANKNIYSRILENENDPEGLNTHGVNESLILYNKENMKGGVLTNELYYYTSEVLKSVAGSKNINTILEGALKKIAEMLTIESAGIYHLSSNQKSYLLKSQVDLPVNVKKEIKTLKYSDPNFKSLFNRSFTKEIRKANDIISDFPDADKSFYFLSAEIDNDLNVLFLFIVNQNSENEFVIIEYLIKELNTYLLKLALTNQLVQSEKKYATLFENATDAVVLMNENGFIDCNNKSLEVFNSSKEEFLNASLKEFFPDSSYYNKYKRKITDHIKTSLLGKPQFFNWICRKQDGHSFHSEISITRIDIDDQEFVLAFIRDISDKKNAEKQILEKDILFKTLADNAPVLLRMTDDKNKFYYFNKPWLAFTGKDLSEEQNNGWVSNIDPEDAGEVIPLITSAITSKKKFEISYRLRRYDGVYRWILDKGIPYTDGEGNFIGYISSAIDITERKYAEEELRKEEAAIESLQKLQNTLEGAHLIAFTIDRDLNISYCNKFLLKTTGFRKDELINKNIFKVLFLERDNRVNSDFLKLLESWTLSENNEAYIRTKSSSPIIIRFNSTIITNSKGDVVGLTIVAEDVTERKRVMQELEESEEKFRNIYESFQDLYFQCDLDGIIKMVSPSVLELIGYSEEDVLNKNITDYYLYNKRTKDLIKQLLVKGRVRNFEASLINKNGKIIQFICNVRLLYTKRKKPFAIEGVARDITDIKKATEELVAAKEVAEKSLAVKERFLANMSHEIRTPMNGIIGMIDLVNGTSLNTEQKDYIQTIKKSSETLLNILNDILDLSKIEAGKMELRESPIRLESLLEKLYALFSQQAYSKKLRLYYYYDKKLPEYVMADETRLLQILSNLTSNAIKFTESGGSVNIGIREVEEKENGKILVRVDVKDSGIGISKEHQKILFTSFTQVDNSTTKNYSGTGLGLVISKELAKLMNGTIGVYSTFGLGSTFWFTFETEGADKPVEDIHAKSKEVLDEIHQFQNYQPKILLVDDNLINQKVASQILNKSGCKVEVASNGIEAIEKVKRNKYDIIFMDIQMPEMDGVTATKEIRKLGIRDLPPILAMTAYSMREDRERFLNAGMDDYIAKPIKANTLIDKVKEWIPMALKIEIQESGVTETTKDELINQEVIHQLLKYGDEAMLYKIYEDFVVETEEQIQECFESLKISDTKNLLSVLHTMKGNAGTLGIEKLANFAKLLENKLKQGDFENLLRDFKALEKVFIEFHQSYKQYLTKSL